MIYLRPTSRREPNFLEKYRLGAKLAKHLDPLCTLEEVGAQLGISKQNAYTESVVALGKLAWKLRESFWVPE